MPSGWIKGSTTAIIRVFQEKADNSKGNQLLSDEWIQGDEYVELLNVERQRIIFDYKYKSEDPWNTPSVHAWCYEDKDFATLVP